MSTHELEATFLQLQDMHQRLQYLEKQQGLWNKTTRFFSKASSAVKKHVLSDPWPSAYIQVEKRFRPFTELKVKRIDNGLEITMKKKGYKWEIKSSNDGKFKLSGNPLGTIQTKFVSLDDALEVLITHILKVYKKNKGKTDQFEADRQESKKITQQKTVQEARDEKSNVSGTGQEKEEEEDPGYHPEFGSKWRTDQFW